MEDQPTFVGHTRIEITEASADRARGRLEISDIHRQPYGLVHGGVLCTLIETIASIGAALWALDQEMQGAVGISNQSDFLRATRDGVLLAEATPVHRGKSQQLWRVVVTREGDGKMAAQGQVRLQNVTDIEVL